ncbi:hypothetical protein ACFLYY_02505 [Patescibacteria group bacterium]
MKILICGSMTCSKKMIETEKGLLELKHKVVLPSHTKEYAELDSFEKMHSESAKNKIKEDLIRDYYNKIKDSDAILVVNEKRNEIDNYIGGNSFLEMGFAHVLNKKIFLLNEIPKVSYKDEIEVMRPVVLNGDLGRVE